MNSKTILPNPLERRAIRPKFHFKVPRWHFGKGRTGLPSEKSESNTENAGGANREVGADSKASDLDASGKKGSLSAKTGNAMACGKSSLRRNKINRRPRTHKDQPRFTPRSSKVFRSNTFL